MRAIREFECIRVIETSQYIVSHVQHSGSGESEILIQTKSAGRHRARHNSVEILSDSGELLEVRKIDTELANIILNRFKELGDTESFRIFRSELEGGNFVPRHNIASDPLGVRHKLTQEESSFTANGSKLLHHGPIFQKYAQTGFGSIIRATLTNHQVCASNCQFCSTISRNKRDSVSLDEAIEFVNKLYFDQADYNKRYFQNFNDDYKKKTGSDIRLRGLILSGGGQPNLWPHFTEFVNYLSSLDISLGLITNGFPQRVPESIYENFEWIRISITPESASPFYPGGRFDRQYMPDILKHNSQITVGYSYVFGPWTNDDIIRRISTSIDENGFEYCRMLTDCNLPRNAQIKAHQDLAERLYRLGLVDSSGMPTGKIFHQLKYHGNKDEAHKLWDGGQCFLQTYNVFWDTTGHEENGYSYCYPCDSVTVLADVDEHGLVRSSERKFNSTKWGTVKNTEVSRLFTEPVKPFFDPREICTSCLFMKNNRTVKELSFSSKGQPEVPMPPLKHVNFP